MNWRLVMIRHDLRTAVRINASFKSRVRDFMIPREHLSGREFHRFKGVQRLIAWHDMRFERVAVLADTPHMDMMDVFHAILGA